MKGRTEAVRRARPNASRLVAASRLSPPPPVHTRRSANPPISRTPARSTTYTRALIRCASSQAPARGANLSHQESSTVGGLPRASTVTPSGLLAFGGLFFRGAMRRGRQADGALRACYSANLLSFPIGAPLLSKNLLPFAELGFPLTVSQAPQFVFPVPEVALRPLESTSSAV